MSEVETIVRVGISDMNVVEAPEKISTAGLGSCIGIIIYDELKFVAGMVHIMLPDSKRTTSAHLNEAKYADTGVESIIDQLQKRGVHLSRMKAKIAGGAQMFSGTSLSDMMRIGTRNIAAVEENLSAYNIPIISKDVGGNKGRTIEFDPKTSRLKIRSVQGEEFYI